MFDILIRLWNEVWYVPFMVCFISVLWIFVIIDYIFKFISGFMDQKKEDSKSKDNLEIVLNQKKKDFKSKDDLESK